MEVMPLFAPIVIKIMEATHILQAGEIKMEIKRSSGARPLRCLTKEISKAIGYWYWLLITKKKPSNSVNKYKEPLISKLGNGLIK